MLEGMGVGQRLRRINLSDHQDGCENHSPTVPADPRTCNSGRGAASEIDHECSIGTPFALRLCTGTSPFDGEGFADCQILRSHAEYCAMAEKRAVRAEEITR
jgi:hypothetical protein